tara:strand:+ start:699 stop:836 length:138 start_codon:yes stop_codon:yes gene_type:complete
MEQPPEPPQQPVENVPLDPEVMLNPLGVDQADPNQGPWLDAEEVD